MLRRQWISLSQHKGSHVQTQFWHFPNFSSPDGAHWLTFWKGPSTDTRAILIAKACRTNFQNLMGKLGGHKESRYLTKLNIKALKAWLCLLLHLNGWKHKIVLGFGRSTISLLLSWFARMMAKKRSALGWLTTKNLKEASLVVFSLHTGR